MTPPVGYEFGETVRRGLRNLRVFSGRDTRPQFWLYMAAVYGGMQVSTMLFFIPSAVSLALGHDPFANGVMLASMVVMLAAFSAFVAAAITRRLHDTGRRGAWGLLPLPPLAVQLPGMWQIMRLNGSPATDELPTGFVLVWLGGLVYFVGIAAVIVLCVLPGTAGPNRYGPATTPPPPPPFRPPPPPYLPPPGV